MQRVLEAKVHLLEESPESARNEGAAQADQKVRICLRLPDHKRCLLPVGRGVHSFGTNLLSTGRIPVLCCPNTNAGWLLLSMWGRQRSHQQRLEENTSHCAPTLHKMQGQGEDCHETWPHYSATKETIVNFKLHLDRMYETFYNFRLCMWIFKVIYIPVILYGNRARSFSILILILSCNLTPTLKPQFHENGNHVPNL